MLRTLRKVARLALAGLLIAPAVFAQSLAPRDLPRATKEIDDPLTLITMALEFRAGQLLAVDGGENTLVLADFGTGARRAVGRSGSGPGEYRGIAALMKLRGDTIWVYDVAQRIVVFNPDLNPGTTFPFVSFDAASQTAVTAPIVADAKGTIYASGMRIDAGRGGGRAAIGAMKFPDTVAVLRFDLRANSKKDTLGIVKYPTGNSKMEVLSQTQFKYTFGVPGLTPSDAWAVFPDGRVAFVYGDGYRVQFVAPNGTKGPMTPVPYDRIPMSEADRKAEVDNVNKQMAAQEPAIRRQMPPTIQMAFEVVPPASWPTHYPPISPLQAIAAPNGDLWVKRATPAQVDREMWDVIDRNGRLVGRWRLPAKTTVVAVGVNNALYTVRTDEDDLRYLQQVSLPAERPVAR